MINPISATEAPANSVIEWYEAPTNLFLGLTNLPATERRTARVIDQRDGYALVAPSNAETPSSTRRLYAHVEVTVLAERAEAGWGRL